MQEIVQAFEKYNRLTSKLYDLALNYSLCFRHLDQQTLKEIVLSEKISEEEKVEIEDKIAKLEIDIENVFIELLNCTNLILTLLERGGIFNFNMINKINREHIEAMHHYENIISEFRLLEKHYTDYNFTNVIDFSKMEKQKVLLNNSIGKFNSKFLSASNIKLFSVYDCEEKVFQIRKQLFDEGL